MHMDLKVQFIHNAGTLE